MSISMDLSMNYCVKNHISNGMSCMNPWQFEDRFAWFDDHPMEIIYYSLCVWQEITQDNINKPHFFTNHWHKHFLHMNNCVQTNFWDFHRLWWSMILRSLSVVKFPFRGSYSFFCVSGMMYDPCQKIKLLTLIHVYLIQAPGVAPSDWVITNVTRDPLTFLDILAFIICGDTYIYGNVSVIIIIDHFKYWQTS